MRNSGKFLAAAALAGSLMVPVAGFGQQGIERRQETQHRRIEQGVRSGELTRREVRGLAVEQRKIEREQRRAASDGVVTSRERAGIQRDQNQASRHIARQKHDRQVR
jgi:hypothetical protein